MYDSDVADEPAKATSGFTLGGEELAISEKDMLSALKAERLQSIGFEDNGDLKKQREQALEYIKGEMKDVPARKKRSSACSSDVSDAIETILPDLIEIFTGGEDIGTFKPQGPEDEQSAKLETDYVNEVIFDQNDGFMELETALRDALSIKVGILKHYWEDGEADEEVFEGKTAMELEKAQADGDEVTNVEPLDPDESGVPLFNFTVRKGGEGKEVIEAVDPNNFGVSADTVKIHKTNYCIERSYPRAFELTDMGYDSELVERLSESGSADDDEESRSRDTVGENDDVSDVETKTRRTVEVHTHTIRIDADGDGKTELWCVVTDSDETLILDGYRKNRVGYSAGSPYRVAHRFYGKSVADLLLEVQRIKTSLMRMLLDNGYFSLNQRHEIDESGTNKNTIADLLRNEPGFPVRVKRSGTVKPIQSAGLNFDAVGALEYFSTVGEGRSGVVRNAQGMNPDTLHDTKGGALALMNAAARRTRMIARVLAETLLKGLFVGVHGDLREHSSHKQMARFNNQWVPVSPTSWASRADMSIEVGVGSGGREMEIAAIMRVIGLQKEALEAQAQGVIKGEIITGEHLFASFSRLIERLGLKAPERYAADPAQMQDQPQQEGPSPEQQAMMAEQQEGKAKFEAEQQEAQARFQADQQHAQAKLQGEQQLAAAKLQAQRETDAAKTEAMREQAALANQLARERATAEMQLARDRAQGEYELAKQKAVWERDLASLTAQAADLPDNRPGGDLSK